MTNTINYRPSVLFVLGLLFFHTVTAQLVERDFHKMIGVHAWSPEELNAFENGEIVVRRLETDLKQELASIGILRIRNLPAIPMAKFRESLSQKGSGEKKGGGRFSEPPTLEDVRTLELEKDAIEQLKKCTVRRCDLNLSAEMIMRFQREIDWTSPDAESDATALIAEMLVASVREYITKGNGALGTYENRRKTVDLAASHRSLLSSSALINGLAPEFVEYLEKFPSGKLENVESSMQWSIVDFGLKPSITVSHATAYTQTKGEHEQLFVASKQIYSSRYLDSSLSFTLLLRIVTENGVDAYLIFVDRSRSDALEGPLGRFARDLVQKESMDRIKTLLDKVHVRLLAEARSGNKTSAESHDADEPLADWMTITRRRTTLAVGGILILVAVLVIWRRKRLDKIH